MLNIRSIPLMCVILLSVTGCYSQSGPKSDFKLEKTDKSPQGDITINYYRSSKGQLQQVWLSAKDSSSIEPKLLYQHERYVEIKFSPDENWIAVNDYLGSSMSEVFLFTRRNFLDYREERSIDINGGTWKFFSKCNPQAEGSAMDHIYVRVECWAANSNAMLLALSGHNSPGDQLDDWFCVYDLETLSPSLNLELMNRDALEMKP
ncbi:MAG TPA: hypothetical protein VMS71_00060 [Candidatus Acidoferrum sp.]|nr:hypothetical protein [Candidatus Acidoferrum sp.]